MGIDELLKPFLQHGTVGIVAVGLGIALRAIVKKYEALQARLDAVQDERLSTLREDRDGIVKVLAENTRVLAEVAEVMTATSSRWGNAKRGGDR